MLTMCYHFSNGEYDMQIYCQYYHLKIDDVSGQNSI